MDKKKEIYTTNLFLCTRKNNIAQSYKTIPILFVYLLFIIIFTSCSSLITINMQKFYSAKIKVNIYFEDFFTQYLYELIGITTLEELFPEEDLRTYLKTINAISQIKVEYKEDIKTIMIDIHSNNIRATLHGFQIIDNKKIIASDMQEFTVKFSRKNLFEIISNIPKYKDAAIIQSFFPEKNPFGDNSYASYLAWSLNDYGDEKVIKDTLEKSYTKIEMKKVEGFGKYPDKNWKKSMAENTQYIDYYLMDMMNQKALELSFTF